ncbi:MAG TPA: hypothetical protein V6D00_03760 [Pantanalinema sp.]
MAKKRQAPVSKKKRRKKRRHDPRAARIRGILIGGALVLAAFVGVGLVALYELQVEEAERLEAARATAAPRPTPTNAPSASSEEGPGPSAQPTRVADLKLGLPESKVRALLGVPDEALDDHRFRYERLGLELAFEPGPNGAAILSAIRLVGASVPAVALGEGQEALLGALGLSGIAPGGDPHALREALPGGRIVFHRDTGHFTLYAPERRLAVDFTQERITEVRQDARMKGKLEAELKGPRAFEVSFSRAFDAQGLVPQALSDHQVETRSRKIAAKGGAARAVDLRLKVDTFDVDDLRALIKRRVSMQIAAGDAAVAITVRAKNGSKLVACDWYSPRYAQAAGEMPERLGSVDSADNISWRWY